MKKNAPASKQEENIWDEAPTQPEVIAETVEPVTAPQKPQSISNADYDLEGLMTDFPTAKDLERFVFDETGIVLNLKGRANKLKYQVAMDVLNGVEVEDKFIGGENPYVDKNDMVPEEPLRPRPERDSTLPNRKEIQNSFWVCNAPHPNSDARSQDKKCHLMFRKYNNGVISYEIEGPLELVPHGEKIDKFGRTRPEIMKWLDPRTGEQIVMREDGSLTPQGKKLRAMMQGHRVNNSNYWDVFVDRDFIDINGDSVVHNPWDLDK